MLDSPMWRGVTVQLIVLWYCLSCNSERSSSSEETFGEISRRCQGHHEEAACEADPDCYVLFGHRLDPVEGCLREGVAGCLPQDQICPAEVAFYFAPDGACWMFGACLTDGAAGSIVYEHARQFADAGMCSIQFDPPLCN